MKITPLQKKIMFSVFAFVIGGRAARYTYLKQLGDIFNNGSYFNIVSLFYEIIFVLGVILFVSSAFGFMSIIRELWVDRDEIIVRERYIKVLVNSIWTLFVSIVLALIVKVLIWP
jgi:hypothetical protein